MLTYNTLTPPDKPNLYMGIGMWSAKEGLSQGLPIDVLQMLLAAKTAKGKLIILLADSMAEQEGAKKEEVAAITALYKKSLAPLLELLQIEDSEIVLSSELEQEAKYQKTYAELKLPPLLQEDQLHSQYIQTQTAITQYMHLYRDVGVKVGWIYESSKNLFHYHPESLPNWDELKFDKWHKIICPDSTLQYLYAKAGLKLRNIADSVCEGCPYTAYENDHRLIIQTEQEKKIEKIAPKVAAHWKNALDVCRDLKLVPESCIARNNERRTAFNCLNYLMNKGITNE